MVVARCCESRDDQSLVRGVTEARERSRSGVGLAYPVCCLMLLLPQATMATGTRSMNMDEQLYREKIHVVWGCVFLVVVTYLALMGFIGSGAAARIPWGEAIMGSLIGSILLSVVTVSLLLTTPSSSPTLVAGGRILLWAQVGAILTAGILILIAMS